MSENQQRVRKELRSRWLGLISDALPSAVAHVQARETGRTTIERLRKAPFSAKQLADLARANVIAEPIQLKQVRDDLLSRLVELAKSIVVDLQGVKAKYKSGAALREVVGQELDREWDSVRRCYDVLCETLGTDRLASRQDVRAAALVHLSDSLRLDCQNYAQGVDDKELKRWLKALAILVDDTKSTEQKHAIFQRLEQDSSTSSLPYVMRYLIPQCAPEPARAPQGDLSGEELFTEALIRICPEASYIRDAVRRFSENEPLFGQHSDPHADVNPVHSDKFSAYPDFISAANSQLVVPKKDALASHRLYRYRIPDGIVALSGLLLLIEWLLRQATFVGSKGAHEKPRAADLLRRLEAAGLIDRHTVELSRPFFDSPSMSIRDAVAHGVFFGDDPMMLERTVHGAQLALDALLRCLERTLPDCLTGSRWDTDPFLDPAHISVARTQLKTGLVVFDQMAEPDRRHLFAVIAELTPDKRALGWASFLFYTSAYQELATRKDAPRAELFASSLGLLISLEDLLRAVAERANSPVLRIEAQPNNIVKCGLAMFDSSSGHLLDPITIQRIFGESNTPIGVTSALEAMKSYRDGLMHGRLSLLSLYGFSFTHLAIKLLYALSSSVTLP